MRLGSHTSVNLEYMVFNSIQYSCRLSFIFVQHLLIFHFLFYFSSLIGNLGADHVVLFINHCQRQQSSAAFSLTNGNKYSCFSCLHAAVCILTLWEWKAVFLLSLQGSCEIITVVPPTPPPQYLIMSLSSFLVSILGKALNKIGTLPENYFVVPDLFVETNIAV